jgi:signal peptidase I
MAGEGTWILLRGTSMEPAYVDGDRLLVQPLAGAPPIRPSEVVVARRGRRLVTHRVVDVRDGMVITKGDACPGTDPPMPLSALLGRVTQAHRGPRLLRGYRTIRRFVSRALRAGRGGLDER